MGTESQELKKSTHARIYTDKKDRLKRIARVKSYKDDCNVNEIDILDKILERELPKEERKLGI